MSKYVNAADAAEKIAEKHGIRIADLCDTFGDIPAADVAPVRRGKWIHSEIEDDDWGRIFHKWTCSVCGYSVGHNPTGENYYPNCGAKMDKEAADGTERTN